ncbi:RND transporter [Trinickia dabaoshanensis]|uniref:RND transporter n=1 Tax=Trinickia dabaoshanensis TaxID=564714 RepID=A0A2N7VLQ7_9BURK|nr:efflux transporter outer membrane subunit [Trinickia dabaoshanensis]PMS18111.1 RND transporter [Trinickia dabaoshanensis]
MQLTIKTSVIAVFAALATSACSLGPSGAPPAMPSPTHYGAQPQPQRTVEAAGTAQRFDVGAAPVPQWWRLYRSEALDALVEEGLRNNPTLAATRRSLNAAQEDLRAQVGASTLPSIDALAQADRVHSPVVPGIGPSTERYNVFAGQLQAQYNFDLFGAVRYGNKASAARVDVQAYEVEAARRALAANIVGAAINVAALDRQIALTERLATLASDTARDDAQRQALGSVSHAQALASARQAAALAATLPPLRQQRTSALNALAVLLGRTPDAAPAVPELASLALPEHVPVAVPAQLLRSRPDVQAAQAALQAAAADVGQATAQLFPSLSLTASMGRAGFSWPALLSGAGGIWAIGASAAQPIFHGGALLAHRRATKEAYEVAVLHYKSTVLSAFENVADSLAALDNDAQTLASTESEASSAHALFDETSARYRLGALPLSAAQASEQQYLTAQVDAVRAQRQRLGDTAALFQAMGELPPEPGKRASHD